MQNFVPFININIMSLSFIMQLTTNFVASYRVTTVFLAKYQLTVNPIRTLISNNTYLQR